MLLNFYFLILNKFNRNDEFMSRMSQRIKLP